MPRLGLHYREFAGVEIRHFDTIMPVVEEIDGSSGTGLAWGRAEYTNKKGLVHRLTSRCISYADGVHCGDMVGSSSMTCSVLPPWLRS